MPTEASILNGLMVVARHNLVASRITWIIPPFIEATVSDEQFIQII